MLWLIWYVNSRRLLVCLLISSVQSLSHFPLFPTPWTAAWQASISITSSQRLLKFMSIELAMPSNHLILCCPLLLLPSIFPSIRVFSNQSVLHIRCQNKLEFQLQHQSLQRTPRTDLLQDGLVGSPCSPRDSQESSPTPQFKNINSSVLSFVYSPTLTSIHDYWKNHSLDQMDFVCKGISLLYNMLSRLVITFLPSSKCLLISWLQSPYAVILEPRKLKSASFHCFPIYLP